MHFLFLYIILLSAVSWTVSSKGLRGGRIGGGRGRTSSGRGKGGSGDTGHPAVSYGSINTHGRQADYFGGGGGKPITLPSNSVFAGRQMGGGSRAQVPGTRRFGSGYPYSKGDISKKGVDEEPFPFGFWPIFWDLIKEITDDYLSNQYGGNTTVTAQRPGGDQVIVELIPDDNVWNTSTVNGVSETYWMIGDSQSVTVILDVLTDVHGKYPYGCSVQNQMTEPFNSSNSSSPVHFNNVIQYYRASSFALAYEGYNNTYARSNTTGLGWNASTPLPTEQLYSPYLQCINNTIMAGLPIMDQSKPPLSTGAIIGISIGVSIFLSCCGACCKKLCED